MLKLQGENVLAFNCQLSKIILSITLIMLNGYHPMALNLMEGQIANLEFPYPCDSTQVTIQHRNKAPFYRLTDVSSSQNQAQRFNVQNIHNIDGCFLNLTIRNLVRNDEGTYLSSVYKNGTLLDDDTHWIWLSIDYPPGKATCVEGENKGGGWMALECTANIGSVPGKIECYQNGSWIFPLTDPLESDTTLKQTIQILATQPVFCCSSVLRGQKDRCECNDTALYLPDGRSKDPCPPTTTVTPVTPINNITQSSPSHPSIHATRKIFRPMLDSDFKLIIISSAAGSLMIVAVLLIILLIILLILALVQSIRNKKKKKDKETNNERKFELKIANDFKVEEASDFKVEESNDFKVEETKALVANTPP